MSFTYSVAVEVLDKLSLPGVESSLYVDDSSRLNIKLATLKVAETDDYLLAGKGNKVIDAVVVQVSRHPIARTVTGLQAKLHILVRLAGERVLVQPWLHGPGPEQFLLGAQYPDIPDSTHK